MNPEELAAAKLKHQQTLQLRKEEKLKDFDSYIYDYKIWEKCKKVIVVYEDDSDEDDTNEDDDNEFWMLYWFHELLFEKYYDNPGKYTSRLEQLVISLEKAKHEIMEGDVNCTGFLINRYENIKHVIKEWITHSGIATKQMLIEQLPLCDDVHKLILTLKIY